MFELENQDDDQDIIATVLDQHNITEVADREDLRPLLSSLADGSRSELEATVMAFIALYVVQELDTWRTFVTEDNLSIFACDSVLIMCSEATFLTAQPWMRSAASGESYDLLSNFICFLAEQFISIYEP